MTRLSKRVGPDAETVGLQALAFVAADDALIDRFLALTGMGPAELRERAQDPVVLGAVLDFLLVDDSLVLAFAAASDLSPEAPMQARRSLPGSTAESW
ncbi:DUF3572 domain-containing protein [Caenispirillum bisanense]|uniref:DUF3572 domain-containing protein n=1 Tax=Caenispirillum bisanense TaxID=414052 RepID=A0A286GLR7_9PROT|nr:DUF3572 domain-containing protein [Caenispirillum bisanense]SOD96483.1 Protein of unknown function [Caenispirillum bisanense]